MHCALQLPIVQLIVTIIQNLYIDHDILKQQS